MSSLVTELLSSAGQLAKDDIKSEIEKLSKRVAFVKNEVMETLNNLYGEFDGYFTEAFELHRRLNAAVSEAQAARGKLEEELRPKLGGLVSKYEDVTEDFDRTTVHLAFLKKLTVIHNYFQEADRAEKRKDYAKAAACIDSAGKELVEIKYGCEGDIKILRVMKTEQLVRREKLIYGMNQIWNEHVTWSMQTGNDRGTRDTFLAVTFASYVYGMSEIVDTLTILRQLTNNVKIFGRNLMKLILKPVMSQSSAVTVESQGEACRLMVSSWSGKPEPKDVFDNVRTIFGFLHDALPDKNKSIMNNLGEYFGQQFCEDLTQDCINPAIPSDGRDLERYEELVVNLADLEDYLHDVGFLTAENIRILSYAKNVDILFANRRCQEILAKARTIMQGKLHLTVKVPDQVSKTTTEVKTEPGENFEFQTQVKCLEEFPECEVSMFIIELLELLHGVLREAGNGAPACSTRMFYMTRHICDLFCDTMPVYHKDNISMYPQQTAIHHNNCMYLSHNLLTLGHRYQRSLSLPPNTCMTYTDLVMKMRKVGAMAFLEQTRRQRHQLLEFLQEENSFQNLSNEAGLDPCAEKAVKKCLHLLTSLKTIWSSVLPQSVYLKVMAMLTNSCIEEITSSIVRQEDITENVALQLNTLFGTIESEVPSFFKLPTGDRDGKDIVVVQKHIPKWQRFVELKQILVSSLHEILNRWVDGKGPLAVEFRAEEVKHMIRALFQNTDRRAAALAKIK